MNPNVTNSLNIQNIPVKKVHVGDIDIAYKTFGKGNPILLIAGAGMTMGNWPPSVLNQLALNHTVVIFDNRGVGNTTAGTKPFLIQQFTNDTIDLLGALKIQKADVLGFSLGSLIAQELAITHPEKVNRLILYASLCGGKESIPPNPQVLKAFVGSKALSLLFTHEWIKTHPNYLSSIPRSKEIVPETTLKLQLLAFTKWLPLSDTCDQLAMLSKPALIIAGTEDMALPPGNSLIIAGKIPSAWLVQIRGGGHGLMYQYPDKFSKVLQTFLSTTTGLG
jgi:pimeloyl-ACP methyl ester carboxylesterase